MNNTVYRCRYPVGHYLLRISFFHYNSLTIPQLLPSRLSPLNYSPPSSVYSQQKLIILKDLPVKLKFLFLLLLFQYSHFDISASEKDQQKKAILLFLSFFSFVHSSLVSKKMIFFLHFFSPEVERRFRRFVWYETD